MDYKGSTHFQPTGSKVMDIQVQDYTVREEWYHP